MRVPRVPPGQRGGRHEQGRMGPPAGRCRESLARVHCRERERADRFAVRVLADAARRLRQ